LRTAKPGISITSDIIVGFPGETEQDFAHTRDFIETAKFDDLFIFHYTDRHGTRACSLNGKIPYEVKIKRLKNLNALQRSISRRCNERLVGATVDVFFEGASTRDPHILAGRTRSNKVVNCPAPSELIGSIVPVAIQRAGIHSLTGTRA
jgi:tRNA-2-methylthio-N6-dimethylallyladenosine synthase